MFRSARSCSMLLLTLSVAALLATTSASAATPTIALDTSYGDAVTHVAELGRVNNRKLDVTGVAVDSKRRVSLMSNNGYENPSNAGPVQCEFTTVRRLDAKGAIDKSFASNGVFKFPKAGRSVCAGALKTDSRNRLIGTARIVYPHKRRVRAVFRLTTGGRLDKTFGNGGIVRLGSGNWGSVLGWGGTGEPMVVKGDKVVLVSVRGNSLDFVRLQNDGRIDRTYGGGGHVVVDDIREASLEHDGADRIYIAGFTSTPSGSVSIKRAVVRRLTAEGEVDKSYGNAGTAVFATSTVKSHEMVWIEEINVLADGRAYVFVRRQGHEVPEDQRLRWSVVDRSGQPVSWLTAPLLSWGTNFTTDHHRRGASLLISQPDSDNNHYTDEGRQLTFGVADHGFSGETFSAPVEVLKGGQLDWFGLSTGGHDVYTVSIFGEPFADDVETRWIRVQHLKLAW